MEQFLKCMLALSSFLFTAAAVLAQPGCIVGDRIMRNTRIADNGNNCGCPPDVGPTHLLHLLHSGEPTLRLSSNPAGSCPGEIHGTISLHRGGTRYSSLETTNDFSITADASASDLILAVRNHEASMLLTTTPTSLGNDIERMRITPIGHVGIWQNDPRELLHIGSKMTFHVGYENDYLGYNVYRDNTNVDRLIVGTAGTSPGFPLKYGMTRQGVIEIGVGTTEDGAANDAVDWWEGGSPFNAFCGMTMKSYGGLARTSFGRYWPDDHSRVLIKAPWSESACTTDCESALRVISSQDKQLLCVRDGNVIVGEKRATMSATGSFNVRMSVDGILFANELIITRDNWNQEWPDYVFERDYNLIPLAELKAFVTTNKHLPSMPTASQVKDNGIEMSSMQALLLEKIEQLTLYVIQLSEENQTLRAEVEGIREMVK